MHSHSSFLEMKIIIQLSGLIVRLEDTDRGEKPVQLLKWPLLRYQGRFVGAAGYKQKESVGPRTLMTGFTPARLAVPPARGMGIRPCSGALRQTR
jgi:hypothetical protein